MRSIAIGLAIAALAAVPALAKDAAPGANVVHDAAKDAATQVSADSPRVLYICDRSEETRRGFAREFGSPEFATAESASAKGEAWSAPRCISRAEMARLRKLQSASLR